MRGLKPSLIPILVERDTAVVEKEAGIIIYLNGDNEVEVRGNSNSRLGVLAIIGPGEAFGQKFSKAVLCEVGLGKSRPYHEANKPNNLRGVNESISIPLRRKWFKLSLGQYQMVAPVIFQYLQKLTDDKVSHWKTGPHNGNPFIVRASWNFFTKRNNRLFSGETFRDFPIGTRYAVSVFDEYLVADIFWAELKNKGLQAHLRGLARFIDKMLSVYRSDHTKKFFSLKGVRQIEEILQRKKFKGKKFGKYLFVEMLNYLPNEGRNRFLTKLSELIDWNGDATMEHKLTASVYPNPESRLNDIQLRVITGLDAEKDHVVFEVFPCCA